MVKIIFKSAVETTKNNKDLFMYEFQQILNKYNAQFRGTCNIIDFEDVEFIEE